MKNLGSIKRNDDILTKKYYDRVVNQIPTGTAEGDSITINDSSDLPIKDVVIKGKTEQETYEGYNLAKINESDYTLTDNNTIKNNAKNEGKRLLAETITLKAGTTYYFNFYLLSKPTKDTSFTSYFNNVADNSKVNLIQFHWYNTKQLYTRTYTPEVDEEYQAIQYGNANSEIFEFQFWVTTDNSKTTYEKYVGGQPAPNPDYPQDIHRVTGNCSVKKTGKNLFSIGNNGTWTDKGLTFTKENEILKIVGTATASYQGCYMSLGNMTLDDNYKFFTIITGASSGVSPKLAYTRDGSDKYPTLYNGHESLQSGDILKQSYIIIANGSTVDCTIKFQLEKGTSVTEWEPYKGIIYPLTLGNIELCKIGTYEDCIYKNDDKWYLYKNIGKVVLDGTEDGWGSYEQNSVVNFYNNSLITFRTQQGYCDKFIVSNNTSYVANKLAIFSTLVGFGIYLLSSNINNLTDFKNWLSNNNVTLYYILATPTTTEITDTTLTNQLEALINAETYKNITHIDTTGEDLAPNVQVVYRKDLETVLNNLLSLILA